MSDFTIPQGTDGGRRWLVNDGATGLPIDFTGWHVKAQVRRNSAAADVDHEWSTTAGNATAGADGYVTLTWSSTDSTTWTWTYGVYDIELTDPSGSVSRLDSGHVSVNAEVTR